MTKPMLDDLELQNVQRIEIDRNQVLCQHEIPALEGDFFQGLGRRATRVTLSGVITGDDVSDKLKALREKLRTAEPVPFVSDIAVATRVDLVLVEELGIREIAGKPQRYEYGFTLREYLAAEEVEPEEGEEPEDDEPETETGTLIVRVEVEGEPNFDFSRVTVRVRPAPNSAASHSQTLQNRNGDTWEEANFPVGGYTAEAETDETPKRSGSEPVTVLAGQTAQATIVIRNRDAGIAKAFVIHYRFDKAFVEPCMRHVLKEAVDYASSHPDEKLLIVGHTDLAGSDAYNQALSERRARGVFAFLTFGRDRAAAFTEWDLLRRQRGGANANLNDNWGLREAQHMLQDLGFYTGAIDGLDGPKTQAAAGNFQSTQGLTRTGGMNDATWEALIKAYLGRDGFSVAENRFFENAREQCRGGIVKWLGCGEKDPVENTQKAWRPNRRTELLFVNDNRIPCEIPKPVTFDLPQPGFVGSTWCLGPGSSASPCCFITRTTETEGKWLVRPPVEDVNVTGAIRFADGTPLANGAYVLIAPDGTYMDGERPQAGNGLPAGTGIPGRTDAEGRYTPRENPEGPGFYIMEVRGDWVARREGSPPASAKGNTVCARLGETAPFDIVLDRIAPGTVDPQIQLASPVVVVKKPHTNPARQQVTLSAPASFSGSGLFTRSDDRIRFFTAATGGAEITFNGTDNSFTGVQLAAGVQVFAEGARVSAALDDVTLTLGLQGGNAVAGPPATATMTAVELSLDIAQGRTAAGVEPTPLTARQKINPGRFVHVQDPGNHAGRAMLIVRQAQPAAFAGNLVLRPIDARVRMFAAADEVAAAGQSVLSSPRVVANPSIAPEGTRFWAEGTRVSAALRDTGFMLGIENLENDGDRAVMTVIQFHDLVADIPVTPEQNRQQGNGPVARHQRQHATGAALNGADFEIDFAANQPLILLENAVVAADPVNLSVQVTPAGVPVSWSVLRDTDDHADIVALSPNPQPTLTQNAGDPLRATLVTNAVGSFHIRPFVDTNGNGRFDAGFEREPALVFNIVLARVTLNQDNSIPRANNFNAQAAGAGGIRVSSGQFTIGAPQNAAIHLNALADVVGGGNDGRRGLDNVFAGWINNIPQALDIDATYTDATVNPAQNHREFWIFASNRNLASGGSAQFPTFLPGNPAPTLLNHPLLDTGRNNAGTGGNTPTLTTSRIRTRVDLPLGRRFLVESVDSPGNAAGANHPGFPNARLVRYEFNLNFEAYLAFWTNLSANTGATGDPADRLYSVVQQVDWQMRGEWTVNPATGAITVVTAPNVQTPARNPFNPTARAEDTDVEVRFPTALNFFTRDARN